jgi:hypothetical protein
MVSLHSHVFEPEQAEGLFLLLLDKSEAFFLRFCGYNE